MEAYTVNAFTYDGKGGNPAGVVLDCASLEEVQMQQVAADLGYSETAFVQKIDEQTHGVRFFTPVKEVDLCGHATIASYCLMRHKNLIPAGSFTMDCRVGKLPIEIDADHGVIMEQGLPSFHEVLSEEEIAPCFSGPLAVSGVIEVVSTGLRKIFCPIESKANLDQLEPNLSAIRLLSEKYRVTGIYLFCMKESSMIYSRNFAPIVGIDEDNATGTSVAALRCYLHKHHGSRFKSSSIEVLQGGPTLEPGLLKGDIEVKEGNICRVRVSGKATVVDVRNMEV